MNGIKLKRLSCRNCGGDLVGENNSRIFFCRPCRLAFDTSGDGGPDVQKFVFAEPGIEKEFEKVYFPFQIFEVSYRVMLPDKIDDGNLPVLIPLIFIKNINYFGDIGYYYFLKNITFNEGNDSGDPIFPADRSSSSILPYPEIYVLRRETEKFGLASVSAEVKSEKRGIVMVPFYKHNTDYYDSFLFWKYPSGAVI